MSRREHARAKAEVLDYHQGQLPDRDIAHLERVGVEHVAGRRHEIWDAHLGDERWWVVTNPAN